MGYDDEENKKQEKRKTSGNKQTEAGCFAAGGAIGGAATCGLLGSAGFAIGGTAVGLGLVPFAATGAVIGLAVFGIKSLFDE